MAEREKTNKKNNTCCQETITRGPGEGGGGAHGMCSRGRRQSGGCGRNRLRLECVLSSGSRTVTPAPRSTDSLLLKGHSLIICWNSPTFVYLGPGCATGACPLSRASTWERREKITWSRCSSVALVAPRTHNVLFPLHNQPFFSSSLPKQAAHQPPIKSGGETVMSEPLA